MSPGALRDSLYVLLGVPIICGKKKLIFWRGKHVVPCAGFKLAGPLGVPIMSPGLLMGCLYVLGGA